MKIHSKDLKNLTSVKSQIKPITTRKQYSKKINNQITLRQNYINHQDRCIEQVQSSVKGSNKKNNSKQCNQKSMRSPEIIKLMINELEKQLQYKIKGKKQSKQSMPTQFDQTLSKKFLSPKNSQNLQVTINNFFPNQKQMKSPSKNKKLNKSKMLQKSIQMEDKKSPKKMIRSKKQQKSISKPFQLQEFSHSTMINNKTCQTTKKSKSTKPLNKTSLTSKNPKQEKQNFIFFGDQLVQLNNLSIPLFILQNTSDIYNSNIKNKIANSKYQQSILNVDEKSTFIRHSKVPSFQSVDTEKSQLRYIERSFVQIQDNDIQENCIKAEKQKDNQQTTFFQTQKFVSLKSCQQDSQNNGLQCDKNINQVSNFKKQSLLNKNINQNQILSNSVKQFKKPQKFDFEKIIVFNQSIIKIQKWWKNKFLCFKAKKQLKKLKILKIQKQVLQVKNKKIVKQQPILIINQQIKLKHEESHLDVCSELASTSLSQKYIKPVDQSSQKSSQHEDILKLRQNAAYLQFNAHQQILKQLFSKQKITCKQFQQKQKWITKNLQEQLCDIQSIKHILKQSAKKVEKIMKKTKQDILIIKNNNISQQQSYNNKQYILNSIFKQQRTNQRIKDKENDSIISKDNGTNGWSIQQLNKKIQNKKDTDQKKEDADDIKLQKKCRRLKSSIYEKQMDDFMNQDSEEANSFISNQNRKIFNSPNSASEQDLCSPKSQAQYRQDFEEEEEDDIDQNIFAQQVENSPAGSSLNVVNISQNSNGLPFQNVNFQQLYKDYQQQQQTKKQIQFRIAKQLGMCDPTITTPQSSLNIGINTSIVGIHKFLINFFKFYLYYHKSQFLKNMNMPYGQSIQIRLIKNRQQNPHYALQNWIKTSFYTQDDQEIIYGLRYVIQPYVLDEFFQAYYQENDVEFNQVERSNIELEKIHHRAVFEAFNQELNVFRPYYNIKGPPYAWSSPQKSLTFYYIGQENIQEVYDKTQMRLLKMASHLCGVQVQVPHKKSVQHKKLQYKSQSIQLNSPFSLKQNFNPFDQQQRNQQVTINNPNSPSQIAAVSSTKSVSDFQLYLKSYTQNFNPAYFSCLQDRLRKKQLTQTQEQNQQWLTLTFQEQKTSYLSKLSQIIQQIIFLEECSIIINLSNNHNILQNDQTKERVDFSQDQEI